MTERTPMAQEQTCSQALHTLLKLPANWDQTVELLNSEEQKLKRMLQRAGYNTEEEIQEQIDKVLKIAERTLNDRGYTTQRIQTQAELDIRYAYIEIISAPDLDQGAIARNIRSLRVNEDQKVTIIYNPAHLIVNQISGSFHRGSSRININLKTLLEDRALPSTLIHERLHYEISLAISQRRSGPLKAFYGNFQSTLNKSFPGKSDYAQDGFLSIEEAKAWMVTMRSKEISIRSLLKKDDIKLNQFMSLRLPQLIAEYKNYQNITDDIIEYLEKTKSSISNVGFFRPYKIVNTSWLGKTKAVHTAIVSSRNLGDVKYEVPLVNITEKSSSTEIHKELDHQIENSLTTIKQYKKWIDQRLQDLEKILTQSQTDDAQARKDFIKLTSASK